MLTRLFVLGVFGFWLFMNAGLLRLWIAPNASDVFDIPVEHVGKQIFTHEQTSDLSILQSGRPIGSLTLQPRRFDHRKVFLVDFSGNLLLSLPFMAQQPFSWHGTVEMNRHFELQYLKIHVDARLPQVTFDLELDPVSKEALYTVKQDGLEPITSRIALNEKGLQKMLHEAGIDPTLLDSVLAMVKSSSQSSGGGLAVHARQAQVEIHGERVQAFNIVLRQQASTLAEMDVSQLGQILALKTSFGFTLAPQD